MPEHDQSVSHDLSQSAMLEITRHLELLRDRGIQPQVIEYLRTPPSAEELRGILAMLRLSPRQLLRGGEAKAASLDDPSLDDNRLIEAMVLNPR